MKAIAIFGYGGRMGQAIASLADDFKDQAKFFDFKNLGDHIPDAVIDFSNVEAFEKPLKYCLENNVPLVSGTTGLSESQKKKYEEAGQKIPVLWDANMSLGMQWFLYSLQAVSQLPKDFDLQVEETHHIHKVDAPSGTAIEIQKTLKSVSDKDLPEPLAIRGGGVFGNHKVYMMGKEEVITFEHNVLDRKVFARGAAVASLWLAEKAPGFYRMKDLIKSNQ